jgi:hypothetical protein
MTAHGSAYFELDPDIGEPGGAQRVVAGPECAGPWAPDAAHGGPPSALLVRACEDAARRAGTLGLTALRVSVEFLAPVPLGPLEVHARVLRPGRRVTLARASLSASGREVLQAHTWLLDASAKGAPQLPPATVAGPSGRVPAPDDCPPMITGWDFPYGSSIDWRQVSGDPATPGDAAVWARQRIPLVAGEEPSGLQRAVLVADSANGLSASLDWNDWSFVNVDLEVHLSRPLVPGWVLVDAHSQVQPTGTGLATSVLHDADGVVGVGAQTLLVSPR